MTAPVCLPGCGSKGPDLAPVIGILTLDGEPVANAAVMFVPEEGGRPAEDVTDQQGRFNLATLKPGDGALVGTHTATVTLFNEAGAATDADGLSLPIPEARFPKMRDEEKWIVPERFSDDATSGLSFQVEHGMEPLRIELTSESLPGASG